MISIRNLSKRFAFNAESVLAMDDLSIDIAPRSFVTLLGPSGCGKSTLLRSVAGLETPDRGEIEIEGQLVFSSEKRINVPANKRRIGMVFQSYAIWPHMSVFQNVAFPLQARKQANVRERVMQVLALVGLESMADRPASRLSGGQQQRVAFARAVVAKPSILLLDEPLSNLDADLRQQMCAELRVLQEEIGVTSLYVTHDQAEALSLSDIVAVMNRGRFVEVGSPRELYHRPASSFTARFIGGANMIAGTAKSEGGSIVVTALGEMETDGPLPSDEVTVFVRPENVRLLNGEHVPRSNVFASTVKSCLFAGNRTELELAVAGAEESALLRCTVAGTTDVRRGDSVRVHVEPWAVYVLRRP